MSNYQQSISDHPTVVKTRERTQHVADMAKAQAIDAVTLSKRAAESGAYVYPIKVSTHQRKVPRLTMYPGLILLCISSSPLETCRQTPVLFHCHLHPHPHLPIHIHLFTSRYVIVPNALPLTSPACYSRFLGHLFWSIRIHLCHPPHLERSFHHCPLYHEVLLARASPRGYV